MTPFDPLSPEDFVEANSWQATWFTVARRDGPGEPDGRRAGLRRQAQLCVPARRAVELHRQLRAGLRQLRQPARPGGRAPLQLRRLPVAHAALGAAGQGEDVRRDLDDRRLRPSRRGPGPDGRAECADGDRPVRGHRRRAARSRSTTSPRRSSRGADRLDRKYYKGKHSAIRTHGISRTVHPARAARRRACSTTPGSRTTSWPTAARSTSGSGPSRTSSGASKSCRPRSRARRATSPCSRPRSRSPARTRIEVPYGTAQFSASFTPEDTTLKHVYWTVTEPDGSPTDKAEIDGEGC